MGRTDRRPQDRRRPLEGGWERFNFRGIPAMLVFKDGQEIHRVIGFGGKKQLRAGGAESPQLDEIRTGIKALKV